MFPFLSHTFIHFFSIFISHFLIIFPFLSHTFIHVSIFISSHFLIIFPLLTHTFFNFDLQITKSGRIPLPLFPTLNSTFIKFNSRNRSLHVFLYTNSLFRQIPHVGTILHSFLLINCSKLICL